MLFRYPLSYFIIISSYKFSRRLFPMSKFCRSIHTVHITEFQILLQDKLCKVTPLHTPVASFGIALHSPHLPLILSIVPFPCETTDSSRRILFPRVSHSFDLLTSRSFSFWSFAEDDRTVTTKRKREHEKGNSQTCVLLHLPCATRHYTHVRDDIS